jgi:hypothetical protein
VAYQLGDILFCGEISIESAYLGEMAIIWRNIENEISAALMKKAYLNIIMAAQPVSSNRLWRIWRRRRNQPMAMWRLWLSQMKMAENGQ